MSAVLFAVVAMLGIAMSTDAQIRTFAVRQSSSQRFESSVSHELQQELNRLLAPAGIRLAWPAADKSEHDASFERLIVTSFEGDCSVAELTEIGLPTIHTNRLAAASVTTDGDIQPFVRIDCAQLIRTLRPGLDHLNVPMRNVTFGRALARVMAHEVYHVLAQTTEHDEAGVAKSSFSSEDLTEERFAFSFASLDRIRRNISVAEPTLMSVDRPRFFSEYALEH